MRQIYLDYNATTPIAPSVVEVMTPFFSSHYGNPSSAHGPGRAAREAIEDARAKVANLLGCDQAEIVFTSGGTESNNLALKGIMLQNRSFTRGHLVISAFEHPSVMEPARFLEKMGVEVTHVPVDSDGQVHPEAVEEALRPNTRLVSIMHANNEVGTIQPIRHIAELCHQRNILVHSDASQSAGKIPVFVDELDVDLLTIAGHKFYGPKGIGVLYARSGVALEPWSHGAGHEKGLRSGTENTPYIVGLGHAAYLSQQCLDESLDQMAAQRDRLHERLAGAIPGLIVHGLEAERLPNTLSVAFPAVKGQAILERVPDICASLGSACHSDGAISSTTLAAMGCSPSEMEGTIRLSLGWHTSQEEIALAAERLIDAWEILFA